MWVRDGQDLSVRISVRRTGEIVTRISEHRVSARYHGRKVSRSRCANTVRDIRNTQTSGRETGHKQDIERNRQIDRGHSFGNQQLAEKKISDISVEDKGSMQIRGGSTL